MLCFIQPITLLACGTVAADAGMALMFPHVSQQQAMPVDPSAGGSCGVPVATHSSIHLQHTEHAAPRVKTLDLPTLWFKGTGRRRVDPTTAVAMDHRQS